jgi:hypothetical protein
VLGCSPYCNANRTLKFFWPPKIVSYYHASTSQGSRCVGPSGKMVGAVQYVISPWHGTPRPFGPSAFVVPESIMPCLFLSAEGFLFTLAELFDFPALLLSAKLVAFTCRQ